MKLFVLSIFLAIISYSIQDSGEKDDTMVKGEQIIYWKTFQGFLQIKEVLI
jgi:hypothetical protein